MAFNCPYCGHATHSTAMYMTCEESTLCQQCGLSESDAWLRSQEDELVARFSAYSITPQVEQGSTESKPVTNRIMYASAAAHSFIVSPHNTNGLPSVPSKSNEATWAAETEQRRFDPFAPATSESFDMGMDSEMELSDTATTDSKRSSFQVDHSRSHVIGNLDHEASQAEPYMSLGYEHDQGSGIDSKNQCQDQHLAQSAQLPEEPSTGSLYTPCKDPVYNARSWWDYGGGRLEYRWDCMREYEM